MPGSSQMKERVAGALLRGSDRVEIEFVQNLMASMRSSLREASGQGKSSGCLCGMPVGRMVASLEF